MKKKRFREATRVFDWRRAHPAQVRAHRAGSQTQNTGTKFKTSKTNHPYLRFGNSDEDRDAKYVMASLLKKDMNVAPAVDWDKLDAIGISDKLAPYLIRQFEDPLFGVVTDEAWNNIFRINENVHMELTLEFLSTFKYEKETTEEDIRFRLMGNWHDVSLARFAYLLDLYPEELAFHPYFPTYLSTYDRGEFSEGRCGSFFQEIANVNNTIPRDNKASQIQNLIHRMLHRLLAFTVNQSFGFDKCPYLDLPALWGAINPDVRFHLPHAIAVFFRERAKGQNTLSPICGGNMITRIAKKLGDFSSINMLTVKTEHPKILSESHFKSMIRRVGPNTFDFIGITSTTPPPGFGAEEAQPSASRQSRRRQHEHEQQGPEQEVNLNFLYNQMVQMDLNRREEMRQMDLRRQQEANAMGHYLDDTHQFMGHMYQQAGWQLPPQYPYPTWDQRMGYSGQSSRAHGDPSGGDYQPQGHGFDEPEDLD
ncbi:hypothetical protein L2E82_22719 [Cichorium intybus]|uniref:Uncharacterized protein n=1 Tax=Cichorium intybus TaxID=13427 RepID=A0ACB9DY51_CICIN|nr:hypothetical protein L2E82_22719 [Cichorium intybus]